MTFLFALCCRQSNASAGITERPWTLSITPSIASSAQASRIIINNTAWDVGRCQARLAANSLDGDARFIMTCYYLFDNQPEDAQTVAATDPRSRFTIFNRQLMHEAQGHVYYQLTRKAMRRKDMHGAIRFLIQEQNTYTTFCRPPDCSDTLFCYLLALTFIDLGDYLQSALREKTPVNLDMPGAPAITSHRDAWQQALTLLETLPATRPEIWNMRALVLQRLGETARAQSARKQAGEFARIAAYARLREPMRLAISANLRSINLLADPLRTRFTTLLARKYSSAGKTADTLRSALFDSLVTAFLLNHNGTAQLTEENKRLLALDIHREVALHTDPALDRWEKEYLTTILKSHLFTVADYTLAGMVIDQARPFFNRVGESEMLAEFEKELHIRKSLQQKLAREKSISAAKESGSQPSQTTPAQTSVQQPTAPAAHGTHKSSRPDTPPSHSDAPVKRLPAAGPDKPPVVSEQEQIRAHIDQLIQKHDFIAAYRGVNAYRRTLIGEYGQPAIEKLTRDLETAIFQKHGESMLATLKKELMQTQRETSNE